MKMKRRLTLAAVATLFAACSNHENIPETDALADKPVTIHAGVATLHSRTTTAPLTHGSLGLFFTTKDAPGTKYNASNREVAYDETNGWSIQGDPLLWKGSNHPVTYYAYHPYGIGTLSGNALTASVSAVQTAETLSKDDFLYAASKTTAPDENGIGIAFVHKLSKLTVSLTLGTELTANRITASSVTIQGIQTGYTANLSTGEVTATADANGTTPYIIAHGTGETTFEALFPPQDATFSVFITTGNGQVFKYEHSNSYTFAGGNAYTLNLTVGNDIVNIGGITIDGGNGDGWSDGNEGNESLSPNT